MFIYPFQDESDNEVFAFSTVVTGANIPPFTPHTEWIFLEAIDMLKFLEPWDIGDFEDVLNHLRTHGYYVFKGEFIRQPSARESSLSSQEC